MPESDLFYSVLSDFWKSYQQRSQLSKFWQGLTTVWDNEYLQVYQADLSKSVLTVPVRWHKQWVNIQFDAYIDNKVPHDHFAFEFTATGGETFVTLVPAASPPEEEVNLAVFLNGVYMTRDTDYTYNIADATKVYFVQPLASGDVVYVVWYRYEIPEEHRHLRFAELLTAPKATWTGAAGDAFDPLGQGPYQFGDADNPIEVFVNGAKQDQSFYTEFNSVTLILGVGLLVGDKIELRWTRDNENEVHKHFRFTKIMNEVSTAVKVTVATVTGDSLGFDTLKYAESVFLNGVLLTRDIDYKVVGINSDIILFNQTLVQQDIVEVEYHYFEYLYRHELDPDIIDAPVMQDYVEIPGIKLTNPAEFTIRSGFLFTNVQFEDAWFPDLFVNERTVQRNFGEIVGLVRPNSDLYRRQVQGLWYVLWNGPTVSNIETGLKILLGLPFALTPTSVASITNDGLVPASYEITLSDGQVFVVNQPRSPIVSAGDQLSRFAAISDGVDVIDDVNTPDWYKQFPSLFRLVAQFAVDPDFQYSGYFDDGGFLDDGGIFDDFLFLTSGEADEINILFYRYLKHHVFLVKVAMDLLNSESVISDITSFLDAIKPAYTDYMLVGFMVPSDVLPMPGDSVTLTLV